MKRALAGIGILLLSATVSLAADKNGFSCQTADHNVKITFHDITPPQYLGVRHGDDFYYLSYEPIKANYVNYKPSVKQLSLPVNQQDGTIFRNGIQKTEKVFRNKGSYEIVFSDNLETDQSAVYHLNCKIIIR